ncbi:DUF397 domain-containing protein [Kitasatospora kifunensis]|uniref:DUF397 domain-containing protein n=1 Tax=Kitasatospora kifunensis TaxID=58351 RepID=A0A7W7QYE4_KITKI|nr:DUF397 domain-containing protein [Kitasatospora kifunensis]MBB4922082.1 hypothetical protein [Kitasatospora kifunensis]
MDMSQARWRKSTYSQQSGACVEVADGLPGAMPVRDSKDPEGPVLVFPADRWRAFVGGVKAGDFGTV